MAITKENYVEEINDKKLIETALNGMLSSLDPHSGYLTAEEFKEMNVQTDGEFGGVGIEITVDNGLIKVVSPIDDTPAYIAGIKSGDYISHVDGESVRGMSISDAVKRIRGKKGSYVTLTILREGNNEPTEFKVKRSTIKIASVKSDIKANDIAYIRLTTFSKQTSIGLKDSVAKIKKQLGDNLKGLILDLRNNPGGLLDQAIYVSDMFIDSGEIVSTKGRLKDSSNSFTASKGDIVHDLPIVVLINAGSASASEIVAGALQDHKRAIIIGTKSFGKGSVQTIMPLKNNGAIRMTTSRYYTPSGRSIQAEGIVPDIIIKQAKLETPDSNKPLYAESSLKNHLDNGQKSKATKNDNAKEIAEIYKEDYQLARAIDLLHAMSLLKQ